MRPAYSGWTALFKKVAMARRLSALLLICSLLEAGCAGTQQRLVDWAKDRNAETEVIRTSIYDLQSVAPPDLKIGQTLTIYIEGDGHAWSTSQQPSTDPSPHDFGTVALALSIAHRGVYLARPCQFIMNGSCHAPVWTGERFGESSVLSVMEAVDILKARYRAPNVELVGYSGGAAIALLVAERRDDVIRIQAIAGNLDPQAWVSSKAFSPLNGSLDPLLHTDRVRSIPQRFFIGTHDQVIEPKFTVDFIAKTKPSCYQVVFVDSDHHSVELHIPLQTLSAALPCEPQ